MRPETEKPWWQSHASWMREQTVHDMRALADKHAAAVRDAARAKMTTADSYIEALAIGVRSGVDGSDIIDDIKAGSVLFKSGLIVSLSPREQLLMSAAVTAYQEEQR